MKALVLLVFLASPAFATPVQYTINFTTDQEGIPPTGSFTYDAEAERFSSFYVYWIATNAFTRQQTVILFDLTNAANCPWLAVWIPCTVPHSNSALSFAMLQSTSETLWFLTYGQWDALSLDISANSGVVIGRFEIVESPFLTGTGRGQWTVREDQPETFGGLSEDPVEVQETGSLWLLLSGFALMAFQFGFVRRS